MKNYQLNTLARITLLVTLNLSLIACGGGGDTAAAAPADEPTDEPADEITAQPTNTDCVLGTSKSGDCTI